jgi:hypothetical protein
MSIPKNGALQASKALQRTLTDVALDILRSGVGGKILTSLEMQERLGVGSGTVQKALRHLVDLGAAELRVKGHQGTMVESMSPALLWRAAALPPFRLVLTPPGAIEAAVLARSIRGQLAKHHIGVEFDFVRGAHHRLDLLGDRVPRVALLSRGAAFEHMATYDPTFALLDIGQGTYYSSQTLVVLSRLGLDLRGRERIRVARDPDSFDHTQLTKLEFPRQPNIEYVDCPFPDVPGAILDGRADAGVWHQVVTSITPRQAGLEMRPIDWPSSDSKLLALSHAMLVWRSEFGEIGALLGLLDLESIQQDQERLTVSGIGSPEARGLIPWM